MKKVFRVLGFLVLFIVILAGGGISYLHIAYPKVDPAPDITVEITPERLERGEYLANHVNLCMDCHGIREWDKFAAPPKPGSEGTGGEHFNHNMGFPGDIVSRNITPFGLNDWTDGEVYRAITAGVSKDGSPLFPVMPYYHYGKMDEEDVYSVIAYIRSLPPVETPAVETQLDFPLNLIVRTMPKPAAHQKIPNPSDQIAYGEYMVNASGCYDCHTKQEKGEFIGEPFAGGMVFNLGNGRLLTAPNITPHESTGIGLMTEDVFIKRFTMYQDSGYVPAQVGPTDYQTVMPWSMYSGMKQEDLKAIYAYLRSLPPVENKIERFVVTAMK